MIPPSDDNLIIIGCDPGITLRVGTVHVPPSNRRISDGQGRDMPAQPFFVVREASATEYLAFCHASHTNPDIIPKPRELIGMKFYAILVD